MSEIQVPAGVPEMTPEWMTSVLTAGGVEGSGDGEVCR